jgi:ParB-like chromosome segregation protein Spo0J
MATKKAAAPAPATVIETIALDSVREHPANPRVGDVEAIKKSVQQFGTWRALVVHKATRHVLVGNHLHRALVELGIKSAPAIIMDVDEATARRILLADNRIGELGDYDPVRMLEVMASIKDDGASLDGTGFEDSDAAVVADLIKSEGAIDKSAIKEWTDEAVDLRTEFFFRAPAELQAKIRAVLQREFPGVAFEESISR